MKIVNIYGGLGNALFQICFALYLQDKGHAVKLDMLGLDNSYKRKIKLVLEHCDFVLQECSYYERLMSVLILSRRRAKKKELNILSKVFKRKLYLEKSWGEIPSDKFSYYFGYFQNYNLAEKYVDLLTAAINKIAERNYFSCDYNNGCFIHVRRGDYGTKHALDVHGILGQDYYNSAIECFDDSTKFHIFTNDPIWAKGNLLADNITFPNSEDYIYPDIVDLYKMSRYKKGIIANSTFSFWAALMNHKVLLKKIVCPKKWFANYELQEKSYKIKSSEWTEK